MAAAGRRWAGAGRRRPRHVPRVPRRRRRRRGESARNCALRSDPPFASGLSSRPVRSGGTDTRSDRRPAPRQVRDEIEEQLGPGAWHGFLRELTDRRLDATPWLNRNFREPLYLLGAPALLDGPPALRPAPPEESRRCCFDPPRRRGTATMQQIS